MSPVAPLPAALSGLVLFSVPGLLLLASLRARDREALAWDERVFLAVTVSLMWAAWLGLVLAEAGRFSLVGAALVTASLFAALALVRRRALVWPLALPRGVAEAAPALVVLALAFALHARPTEYLLGGRDPGTYIAAMAMIGRTGGVAYTDPAVLSIPAQDVALFYRHPDGPEYSWGRFMGFPLERPQTGRVVPEFFHLFPAFGAYLFQAMGVKGALATPPVFGILGTLAVFLALRRVLGEAPALLGALLLAVNVVQVWFARYPVTETASQLLIFLGLLCVWHWEARGSRVFAALAGAAFGLSLLVRIDSVLLAAPITAYLLVRWARRDLPWREGWAFLTPLALLAFHAFAHAAFWSRKYLLELARRPYWHQPRWAWLLGALVLGALIALVHARGPALLDRVLARAKAVRAVAVATIAILALYLYFVRPVLSVWAGGDGNDAVSAAQTPWLPGGPLADPGPLRSLGFARLAAHDAQAFLRLGWFVTPLGLALAVLGLMRAVWRWRREYLLPVLVTLAFGGFYFYKIRVYNDYFFALRRFVPVVLPMALGLAAFALWRLAGRGGWRRAAAAVITAFLFASFLVRTWPLVGYVDWRHSVRFVADVARRFGPQDVVVFEQKASIHLLSLPLWAVHGVHVLELARFDPDPERVNHLIRAWRGRWRNVYFVHTYRTDLCGVFLQRVEEKDFGTHEWERAYGRPPAGRSPRSFHFTLARAVLPEELQVPALDEVDLGGSDDFLVSGFYDKEGGYRWTGRCGSVYLPGARGATAVDVTASLGERRPRSLPDPVVEVSLSGAPLGRFTPERRWTTHTFALPQPLPPGAPVLRLDVVDPVRGRAHTWRPANELAGSLDTRDLGVMVDRVRVVRGNRVD
ncbi:MAG TPA: glycosyltransferase family 39 protein [Vicinamibacteria bacterium]|nr:glycosyltransferase family 39 protein [Vicinamibacteria bacterium]